jgi:hypothetical protein
MLAGAGEIAAVGRTRNFDQALGAAADGTDVLTDRRAASARAPSTAERAIHGNQYCIMTRNPAELIGTRLAPTPEQGMSEVVRRESAVEYFKELVDAAILHQRLSATESASFYVVQLLAGFLRRPVGADGGDSPLAIRLAQVLESGGARQRNALREIGDVSLFVSGFFADSLNRKTVDVDYYVSIGGYAYNALSRVEGGTFSPVFAELADKFVGFVDVLSEVSERASCASNADLLRLYERWLRTGSPRSGQLLAERGVVPNSSLKGLKVQ